RDREETDRALGSDLVAVEQIHRERPALGSHGADVLAAGVAALSRGAVRGGRPVGVVTHRADLRGEDRALAPAVGERPADELLVGVRPVRSGGGGPPRAVGAL